MTSSRDAHSVDTHPVIALDGDTYVAWSDSCDAPVSRVMTRDELVAAGISDERLQRLDTHNHTYLNMDAVEAGELAKFNRAGPNESCLTVAALIRCYSGVGEHTVEVADIHVHQTQIAASGHPDDGKLFWVPWDPSSPPDSLDGVDLHAMVPVADTGETVASTH